MANVDLKQIRTVRPATLPLDTKQTLFELQQENLAAGAKSTVATLEEIQSSPATFEVVAAATHTTGLETEIHVTAATCAITADDTTWPIGATKKIWKLSAYDGDPITISPPSGSTFEGRASLSLYGQYSFVELERISSTVFAIKDYKSTPIEGSVNVKDFGAIGDGIADDTASFNSAVLSGFSHIIIPSGTYNISSLVTIPINIKRIDGCGTIKSVLTETGALLSILANGIVIEGLTFIGNGDFNDTCIYSTKTIHISNCDIGHFFDGLNLQSNPVFHGSTISNTFIHNCSRTGLSVTTSAEYVKITSCSINENGIGIYELAGNMLIENNNINKNGIGVLIGAGTNDSHSIVLGNNINHNTEYGIRVVSVTEFMINITENHLFNSGCTGKSVDISNVLPGRSAIFANNMIGGGVVFDANNLSAPIYYANNILIDNTLVVSGDTTVYYSLMSDNKNTREKHITGTTASTQGGNVPIVHGLDASKITRVSVLVYSSSAAAWIPPEFNFYGTNYIYSFLVTSTSVIIYNATAKSAEILSAPVKITIEYEV